MDSWCAGLSSRRTLFEIVVLKILSPKTALDLLVDVLADHGALVVQRDDDAENLEVGIGPRLDLVDRLEEVVGALQGEVGGLDRDQDMRRGDHRVDRDHPEGRRRVDEDRVVPAADAVDLVAQAEVPVDLTEQLRLDLGQRDTRRGDVEVLEADGRTMSESFTSASVRTSNMDFSTDFRSRYDIVLLPWGSRSTRRVFWPFLSEGRRQVDRGRGLSDAALLICDGDDHENRSLPREAGDLHPVLAEVLRVDFLEPLLEAIRVGRPLRAEGPALSPGPPPRRRSRPWSGEPARSRRSAGCRRPRTRRRASGGCGRRRCCP